MHKVVPPTKTCSASVVQEAWGTILGEVAQGQERVLVQQDGVPVVAIVSAKDLARLQEFERQVERDLAILSEFQDAYKDVPADEIEREIARAVAEVRAEKRQQARESPAAS